jgi:hypothetical protein
MKSSFHSLIPFLPLFCNCQFPKLDSIQFLCSQAHILAGWHLETWFDYDFSKSESKSKSHCDWRSISLGVEPPSGAHDQIFITVWQSCYCGAPFLTRKRVCLLSTTSQSQSHIATDGQSVSIGTEPHLGLMTRYLILFDNYDLVFVGRPLWRGRICLLYMLLTLASVFGSESLGTRDHILLSQIWDFPFRRLLRLAGSRWRYSTPPPRGWIPRLLKLTLRFITTMHGPRRKHSLSIVEKGCL